MSERRDTGFLRRWSARKATARRRSRSTDDVPEAKREAKGKAAVAVPPAGAGEIAPPDTAPGTASENISLPEAEAELLERLGLPDPDTLGPGDDFRAFMNSAVPAALRNRALRRLWAANPALANLDGLLEYGEDFTDRATVVSGLETAWSVGKGYARAMAGTDEFAEETPAEARGTDDTGPIEGDVAPHRDAGPETPHDGSAPAPAGAGASAAGELRVTEGESSPAPAGSRAPAPNAGQGRLRRMRFRFDTGEAD